MNEIHEVPTSDHATNLSHDIMGYNCVCRPDIFARYQNGTMLPPVVRHKTYTPAQAASVQLVRGY